MSTDDERTERRAELAAYAAWRLPWPDAMLAELLKEEGLSKDNPLRWKSTPRYQWRRLAAKYPTPGDFAASHENAEEPAPESKRAKRGRRRAQPMVTRDQILDAIRQAATKGAFTQADVCDILTLTDSRELRRQFKQYFDDWETAIMAAKIP